MLKHSNFSKSFEIHIDAIGFAIRGVLMQDGHVITFESKILVSAHLRLAIHEIFFFAMVS